MATRSNFRPRPLDTNKDLLIVRDESQLDSEEPVRDQHVHQHSEQAEQKPAFIPIPPVTVVPTYNTDYLPVHKVPLTFLKAPHDKREIWAHEWQEYDLDVDDCRLLHDINQGGTQDRISAAQLEMILWRLDVMNAEAVEGMQMAGGNVSERTNAAAMASTELLPKKDALDAIKQAIPVQHHVLDRTFEYWKAKRKAAQKPILRRLQPPTPETDNNPYLVFRQRTRPNKPQTRRRRETHAESVEKVLAMLESFIYSMKLSEATRKREELKAAINTSYVDQAQHELRCITGDDLPEDNLDRKLAAAVKLQFKQMAFRPRSLPVPGERARPTGTKRSLPGPPIADEPARQKARKKVKRVQTYKRLDAVAVLRPPPPPVEPEMPFAVDAWTDASVRNALQPCAAALEQRLHARLDNVCLRVGRSGRVYVDRCRILEGVDEMAAPAESLLPEVADASGSSQARLQRLLVSL